MTERASVFARAVLAQKKAASASQSALSKILDKLGPPPTRRPRFLLVDNEESVVHDWRNTLSTYPLLRQHAEFDTFLLLEPGHQCRVKDVHSGGVNTLIEFVRDRLDSEHPIDGFFIDNNLGAGAQGRNGMELINLLWDQIDTIRFFPFALITVSLDNSEARKDAAESDVVRYMPKFDDAALLPRMILEFDEMHADSRQAAWSALNHEVALALETDKSAVEVGEIANAFLHRHMGVRSLYFRDGTRGELSAFVMNDGFAAGSTITLSDAPAFYRELITPRSTDPIKNCLRIDNLTLANVGSSWMPTMADWRALLTRIGDPVNGEGAVYAIYSPPQHRPFRRLAGC